VHGSPGVLGRPRVVWAPWHRRVVKPERVLLGLHPPPAHQRVRVGFTDRRHTRPVLLHPEPLLGHLVERRVQILIDPHCTEP
jgi:hypothetical protein